MPDERWYDQIHARLLAGDPTAPAELVESIRGPLSESLSRKYPKFANSELLVDAVTDSLMSYIKRPDQFDPAKRGLLGFLGMAASGDLLNAVAKRRRRWRKEVSLEDVELDSIAGKRGGGDKDLVAVLDAQKTRKDLDSLFRDPRDRQMAELVLDGERSVEAFVELLEMEKLSRDEQRREVKRHKDRIKKQLVRYGRNIRERRG